MSEQNVLKGKAWNDYLLDHNIKNIPYQKLYNQTYRYEQVFKVGDYYFCFMFTRGYKNVSSLKRLISQNSY